MNTGDVVRRGAAACLVASTVLAAGGCGESPTASLSEGRAARWHETIAGIRSAAAAADRPTALADLARLSGFVDRDAKAGQLAAADAAALKAGIAQARRHLPQPAVTPATALATRAPAPPPVAPAEAQTSTTALPPAAVPPASTKDDAKAQKDDAKAQKDDAKAQDDAAKAQKDAAKAQHGKPGEPRAKAKAKPSKAELVVNDNPAVQR